MRLLTHNYLQSNVKGTTKGYPLIIRPTSVIYEEAPMDIEMLQRIITKIDYTVLKQAYEQIYDTCTNELNITIPPKLPDDIPIELLTYHQQQQQQSNESNVESEDVHDVDNATKQDTTNKDDNDDDNDDNGVNTMMKSIFCALFELHVIEGVLICPDTRREFPIKDGIPNMILHEDEL